MTAPSTLVALSCVALAACPIRDHSYEAWLAPSPQAQDQLAEVAMLDQQLRAWRRELGLPPEKDVFSLTTCRTSKSSRDICTLADGISKSANAICAIARQLAWSEWGQSKCFQARASARDMECFACSSAWYRAPRMQGAR